MAEGLVKQYNMHLHVDESIYNNNNRCILFKYVIHTYKYVITSDMVAVLKYF